MYVLTKDYKVIQPWELGLIEYIKYAPTIEELIDTYVIVNKGSVPYTERKKWDIILSECDKVYGAVGTDKGLIYIAKLNKDGELELL